MNVGGKNLGYPPPVRTAAPEARGAMQFLESQREARRPRPKNRAGMRQLKATLAPLDRAGRKHPFSWPNSSEAIKDEGIDAQFTLMNAWPPNAANACVWREQSILFRCRSLPVINTVESVGATLTMLESTVCRAGDEPDNFLKQECLINLLPQHQVFIVESIFQKLNFFECLFQVGARETLFRVTSIAVPAYSTTTFDSFRMGVANIMDVFYRSVWKNNAIVRFKARFRLLCLFILLLQERSIFRMKSIEKEISSRGILVGHDAVYSIHFRATLSLSPMKCHVSSCLCELIFGPRAEMLRCAAASSLATQILVKVTEFAGRICVEH